MNFFGLVYIGPYFCLRETDFVPVLN